MTKTKSKAAVKKSKVRYAEAFTNSKQESCTIQSSVKLNFGKNKAKAFARKMK